MIFGSITAWVLIRYRFPGKELIDALVDLPFALPTAVAGIVLTTLYSPNGWLGRYLQPWGIQVSYTRLGIIVALTFIGLPFVVRTLQPVLSEIEKSTEEAAASMGANRWQILTRIILPELWPAMLTGFTWHSRGDWASMVPSFSFLGTFLKTEITSFSLSGG
jgi:sulfate transport system permease protein